MKPTQRAVFVCGLALALAAALLQAGVSDAASSTGWLTGASDLEREAPLFGGEQSHVLRSPVLIGQQLNGRSSYLFSRNNGRFSLPVEELRQTNLFQCVEPTRSLYENFARQYNRTFQDSAEKLERLQLFAVTLKRAIVLNRVIQNEIMNSSNQATRNYHFIEPLDNQNLALWYADVTDCELGLIKNVLLDTFHLVDENKHHLALRIVQDQGKSDLPGLLNADGFEQLANILLVRLYDRFKGDEKMNQLFEWPMYFKRLASFAYSQQQAQQPDFKTKLSLVAFAYPAFFKDLKYNHPAVNRTNDNLRANNAHRKFNEVHGRQPATIKVTNRRLSIFRQRWSLVDQLNSDQSAEANLTSRQIVPDWLRVQYSSPYELADENSGSGSSGQRSERLRLEAYDQLDQARSRADEPGSDLAKPFRVTQFSDLTDNEFQAFLSNDFSLLNGNKESADFLDLNFPVRPLTESFRWEIAHELEMRHGMTVNSDSLELIRRGGELTANQRAGSLGNGQTPAGVPLRPSLRLAKQVVDELISDVGLPIGPASLEDVTEEEQLRMFQKVANFFQKPYLSEPRASQFGSQLTSVDLLDERRQRLEQFKENYGRFKAWFIKEGWSLSDAQQVAMLRLADMSWLEIKLSMFKICCLTSDNLIALSSMNATIQYLGSNYDLLCGTDEFASGNSPDLSSVGFGEQPAKLKQQQQQQAAGEIAALEIYYYYSVHFNKHHQNKAEFARRFAIFRNNVESVRRHSCKRSLTLFESLKNKRADLLSTVDTLDPRRSHTDDLNMDRFEYFRLKARDLLPVPPQSAGIFSLFGRSTQPTSSPQARADSSRAGLSYRRDYFANLLDRANEGSRESWPSSTGYQTLGQAGSDPSLVYANKLFESWESVDEATNKYRQNSVARVYDLVMSRYKWCKKSIEGVDLSSNELKQQCQANGRLGDQAAQLGGPGALWTEDVVVGGGAASGGQQRFERLQQQQDGCAFYRRGLDPWADGLIEQESLSAQLIQKAKC